MRENSSVAKPLPLLILLSACAALAQQPTPAAPPTTPKPAAPAPATPQTAEPAIVQGKLSLGDLSTSLEDLVNRIRPAVVQIFSTGYVTADDAESGNAAALLSKQHSTGSGIILSQDGYIVTNAHVVKGARQIQVRLSDMRRPGAARTGGLEPELKLVDAKLVGLDRDIDVAVIKIDRTGLRTLPFGDSDAVKQGELVMAFGNPLGLEGSVSLGIVSSTSRVLHADDLLAYIQTDAPINPGNSGGPLIDYQGRVIGINTFILSQSGGSEGLGFAIPSNMVRVIYNELRKEGHVHRGHIGASVQTITPSMAQGLSLPRDWGVIVSDVVPEGPSDKAGLKIGDLVLTLNHRTLHNARELESFIYRSPMKATVNLGIRRGADQLSIDIPVLDTVDDPTRFADLVNPEDNLVPRLGILAIGIDKKLGALLPDLRNAYGVVVAAGSITDVSSGTGLQPGDVIYSVNGSPVATVEALKKKLDEFKPGDSVVMHVERASRLTYVTLELE